MNDIPIQEAKCFYGFKIAIENIPVKCIHF